MKKENTDNLKHKIHKQIIIGSGPAGLTAAIYSARADLKPLVFAGQKFGGQLMSTTDIENFPGFTEGINGSKLMINMIEQSKSFGAEIHYKDVTRVKFDTTSNKLPIHEIYVETNRYLTHSVIVATGAQPRKLGVEGEENFWGKGVSSCATCDGAFYRDMNVAVIGGGDSAMEEATFLTKFASKVYLIHRRDEYRASKIMLERARNNPKIKFLENTIVTKIEGDETVKSLEIKNIVSQKTSKLEVSGMFLAIGYIPETDLFSDYLDVNPEGYARPVGNKDYPTMSKTNGIFIAGDIEDDLYRQAITAAGDGCKASLDAERWLAEND